MTMREEAVRKAVGASGPAPCTWSTIGRLRLDSISSRRSGLPGPVCARCIMQSRHHHVQPSESCALYRRRPNH
jgi:hypothetical protein